MEIGDKRKNVSVYLTGNLPPKMPHIYLSALHSLSLSITSTVKITANLKSRNTLIQPTCSMYTLII